MENYELTRLWFLLALTFGEYLLILLAIIADLISGVRKARQRGEATHSKGFRRTVEKIASYYNAMFALTIIDAMQIAGITYLRVVEGYTSLPTFPLFTFLGAVGIALIEVKSIYEKSEDKMRSDYTQAMTTIAKYINSEMGNELINLLKSKNK